MDSPGGGTLDAHLSRPHQARPDAHAVLILHGFPSGMVVAEKIGEDLPELGDRLATQIGWHALCLRFRGCGTSTGDFSLVGWVEDAVAGLEELAQRVPEAPLWVIGFGTGGAVGLAAAAADERVTGVAVMATPADFDDWASKPEALLEHARAVGAISDPDFPVHMGAWKEQLSAVRAVEAATAVGQRPLLVLHGADDELVPQLDARAIADAHGGADLRILAGAGHQLRHDPRAVSILLGWLDRNRA